MSKKVNCQYIWQLKIRCSLKPDAHCLSSVQIWQHRQPCHHTDCCSISVVHSRLRSASIRAFISGRSLKRISQSRRQLVSPSDCSAQLCTFTTTESAQCASLQLSSSHPTHTCGSALLLLVWCSAEKLTSLSPSLPSQTPDTAAPLDRQQAGSQSFHLCAVIPADVAIRLVV